MNFQDMISALKEFWSSQGCIIYEPYDVEKGAGTMNPATFLRTLGPEPWHVAYVEPSRRPADGRYGDNPNRLYQHHQFQVICKPSPDNIQELYLKSLETLGINPKEHDIRFVEDNWESPTLGAWGLGWEVWLDGMEITQFTYFQQVGGIDVAPVSSEITYGMERLAMYIQGVENVYDLKWNDDVTYGDIFHQNEVEQSTYSFELSDSDLLFHLFDQYEKEVKVTKEDKKDGTPGIRTIFEGIKSSEVFTVVFKKQDKAKTKKQFEAEREAQRVEAIALIDKAKKQKKSMAVAYKEALEFIQNNPVKDYIEGEDRVLRGYKMQFVSRDGNYTCMDMDIERTEKETGERLVNITTISQLIYNGVKYVVE